MSPVAAVATSARTAAPPVSLPVSGIALARVGDEGSPVTEARTDDGALLGVLFGAPLVGGIVSAAWRGVRLSTEKRGTGWGVAAGPAPDDDSVPEVWFLRRRPGTRFLIRVPAAVCRLSGLWVAELSGAFTAVYVRHPGGQGGRPLLPVTDAVRLTGGTRARNIRIA